MVDLNTATAEQLDSIDALKGHGPEIVRYREERGRFTDLRQLDEVPGCTGKLDAAKSQLTVKKSSTSLSSSADRQLSSQQGPSEHRKAAGGEFQGYGRVR